MTLCLPWTPRYALLWQQMHVEAFSLSNHSLICALPHHELYQDGQDLIHLIKIVSRWLGLAVLLFGIADELALSMDTYIKAPGNLYLPAASASQAHCSLQFCQGWELSCLEVAAV